MQAGPRHDRRRAPRGARRRRRRSSSPPRSSTCCASSPSAPGSRCRRQQILDGVWGYDWFGDARTVDVHIAQVRKKLGDAVDDHDRARRRLPAGVTEAGRPRRDPSPAATADAAARRDDGDRARRARAHRGRSPPGWRAAPRSTTARHDVAGPRRGRRTRVRPAHPAAARGAAPRPAPSRADARSGASATSSNTTLRASNGAVVAVDAERRRAGGARRACSAPRRDDARRCPTGVTRRRPRHRGAARRRRPRTGATATPCSSAEPLAAGRRRHAGGRARRRRRTPRPFGGSGLAVLGAAAIALGVAALVAAYLARRLTRPLAAMETTARSHRRRRPLGAGRRRPHVPDDELAEPGRTHQRDGRRARARPGPRARVPPERLARPAHAAHVDPRLRRGDRRRHRRRHATPRIRAADVIASEARRLERLVADLLDLARLDAHQFSLHPAPDRRARRSSRDAVDGVRARGARARHRARRRRPATPVPADADPERLAQIVANLVENALKYATHVGDASACATDRRPRRAARRRRRARHRAGRPRPACSSGSTRRGPCPAARVGTGIGLAIVHELAAAMGGDAPRRARSTPSAPASW